MLIQQVFGEDGAINADDTVCFEKKKSDEIENLSQSISQSILKYFQKGMRENLEKQKKSHKA